MQRRKRLKAKIIHEEEEEENFGNKNQTTISDSDDEAANEDLTLKIIQKAISRASHASADLTNEVDGEDVVINEMVTSESVKKKKEVKKVKEKKKKDKEMDEEKDKKVKKVKKKDKEMDEEKDKVLNEVITEIIQPASTTNAEELVEASIDSEVVNLPEPNAAENSNSENVVLRRLLRGPRYFDSPDKSWGACFNCGEEGHSAVNCTSARRKRPCFICGSLEHEVKQCQKGQDCFICKDKGHRAKDCPQKMKRCSLASDSCLKCGASGHAMFSCNIDYSPDDLKDIQCYVCKRFGHLCCANYFSALASEASCYKCGHTGHYGQECRGSRGETSAGGTPSSCFKCGEGGHFARECKTSGKAKKRTRDPSTPVGKKYPKDNKGKKGHNSAPQDFGKTHRKKFNSDDGSSPNWSNKFKRRGGWIPDDSCDLPLRNNWRSPSTPNKNHRIFDLTNGGQVSSPHFFRNKSNSSPRSSSSRGYDRSFEHSYTASRFGHPTNPRRNDNWW